MPFKKWICSPVFVVLTASPALGQDDPPPGYSTFPVDVPALDAPYDFDSPALPSMQQSLRLSTGAYQVLHWGVGHLVNPYREGWKGVWSRLAFAGFDLIAGYLPLYDAWTHEEFHRAVMGARGIASFDDVYNLELGASTIAVSHVKDQDLIDLKKDHPADMVRLPAAGVEGETQLALSLEKDAFFDDVRNYHQMAILLAYANSYAYVASGATSDADAMTDEMNEKEDDVPVRDFVGHDFTSWVYDLFRPDEPYEARGMHPSGNGINRYRKHSDLTTAESDYLALQGNLMLLNFVDGALWGQPSFAGPGDTRWNASLQHYLTSFGYTNNLNLFIKAGEANLFSTLLNYRNERQSLWGLELELRRFRGVSLRGQVYRQPTHQLFRDETSRVGGLLAATYYYPFLPRADAYLEIERKSPGWIAGTPYLDTATSGRVGVLLRAF